MRQVISIIVLLGLLSPFIQNPQISVAQQDRVAVLMSQMSVDQKVGQLFMVTLFGPLLMESNGDFIREYFPGAVALFGSNLDYQPAYATTDLINAMQSTSIDADGIPLIVATDQEGGRVWRLINGFTHFPEPLYLGATTNEAAFKVGQAMGREMAAVGVNMNLAPVVDLTTREDALNRYRVLNTRTMGQDPVVVGTRAGAVVQGMADVGVIGVLKHYPGHSPTTTDSHRSVAQVDLDAETFRSTNLRAFETAIEAGADVVMAGHLYYPALEPVPNLPASLSPTMIGILRDEAGFDGVVLSDAFDMGAIQDSYDVTEAAVMAIQAGVDMIAVGPHMAFSKQKAMIERVRLAVADGEITMARVDEAVERVLRLKERHGVLDWEPLASESTTQRIDVNSTSQTLVEAFAAAMTVVRDEQQFLPISDKDSVAILHPAGWFNIRETCKEYFPNADFLGYSYTPAAWEYGAAVSRGRNFDVLIFFTENLHINGGQRDLASRLPADKTIVVSLGMPYDYELLPAKPAGFIAGYASYPEAQIAACQALAGVVSPSGILPVALDGYAFGHGLNQHD